MNKKIGRNDPCLCGSGKKYKKCCGPKIYASTNICMDDIGANWHRRFCTDSGWKLCDETSAIIKKSIDKTLKDNCVAFINDFEDKTDFLRKHLETLEGEMATIIAKYSLYELFFWTHRIKPENIFHVLPSTIQLYRETLSLAIQKYGPLKQNWVKNNNYGIVPSYIAESDIELDTVPVQISEVLKDCYRLEFLAYRYIYTTQIYRAINKGAGFVPDLKLGFRQVASSDLKYLMHLYDHRSQYANISTRLGSYVNINNEVKSKNILIFSLNVTDVECQIYSNKKISISNLNSNYLPYLISLAEYEELLYKYQTEFIKQYGFSVSTLMDFITVSSIQDMWDYSEDLKFQLTMLQRSYSICEKNCFLDTLVYFSHFCNYKLSCHKEDLSKVFDFLVCVDNAPRAIDLWARGPRKVFIPIDQTNYIFDRSGFIEVLANVTNDIASKSGHTGNIKSAHFEDQTELFIKETFNKKHFWKRGKLCRKGTRTNKEIDSSFYIDQFLFIVECKSRKVSSDFDKGTKKALQNRQKEMEKALQECHEKATFISENLGCLSLEPPSCVKYIVPIVCSPKNEYIWAKNEELFLAPDLPRILTLEELKTIKGIDYALLCAKPFTIHISHKK